MACASSGASERAYLERRCSIAASCRMSVPALDAGSVNCCSSTHHGRRQGGEKRLEDPRRVGVWLPTSRRSDENAGVSASLT